MKQLIIVKQITNRESQSLDKYFQEIGKVDLITADEEVILAKRIRGGDRIALEKLHRQTKPAEQHRRGCRLRWWQRARSHRRSARGCGVGERARRVVVKTTN